MSRAERKPTEVGDAEEGAEEREPVADKGSSRTAASPPSGEGCGDTLTGGFSSKKVRTMSNKAHHFSLP